MDGLVEETPFIRTISYMPFQKDAPSAEILGTAEVYSPSLPSGTYNPLYSTGNSMAPTELPPLTSTAFLASSHSSLSSIGSGQSRPSRIIAVAPMLDPTLAPGLSLATPPIVDSPKVAHIDTPALPRAWAELPGGTTPRPPKTQVVPTSVRQARINFPDPPPSMRPLDDSADSEVRIPSVSERAARRRQSKVAPHPSRSVEPSTASASPYDGMLKEGVDASHYGPSRSFADLARRESEPAAEMAARQLPDLFASPLASSSPGYAGPGQPDVFTPARLPGTPEPRETGPPPGKRTSRLLHDLKRKRQAHTAQEERLKALREVMDDTGRGSPRSKTGDQGDFGFPEEEV